MNGQWIVLYLLMIYACLSRQISTPDSKTYTAAVVEYPPIYVENDSESTLKINSDAYVNHIKIASRNGTDIIVFPENGLTSINLPRREDMESWATIIPAASDNYTPCNQTIIKVSKTLKKISCAARNNSIYVVINIVEKLPCTKEPCPNDRVFYYNSNVVFDRNGTIIARYRKVNLFAEPQYNVTSVPEIVIFDTDFGVKFGTFICFDILFKEPALLLTRHFQITDIVFSTAWFSEVPFLTAVQVQAGWSFSEDVNFLAAGYDMPDGGSSGSGIYLGRKGIGTAVFPQTKHEEILIFEVPKKQSATRNKHHNYLKDRTHPWQYHNGKEYVHDELQKKQNDAVVDNDTIFLIHDKSIQNSETLLVERNVTETVCQNDFCCEFKVEMNKIDPSTRYRLVVFNGIRKYYIIDAGVRLCGLIQCSNDSVSSCGSTQKSETVFSSVEITATFHNYKNNLIMPSTLNSDLYPFESWTYDEHTQDNRVHISISLNTSMNNLLTFGIYSRDFDKTAIRLCDTSIY